LPAHSAPKPEPDLEGIRRLEGVGGRYFNDNTEATVVDERPADPEVLVASVAGYALDPDAADRLWGRRTPHAGRPRTGARDAVRGAETYAPMTALAAQTNATLPACPTWPNGSRVAG
jgi:hypothetical protein